MTPARDRALSAIDPRRFGRRAAARLEASAGGRAVLRWWPYAVLPALALFAGLTPQLLSTRWMFISVLGVTYLLMSARTNLFSIAVATVMLAYLPVEMDTFERGIMFNIALYTLLGIGLNVVVGYAGLLDLGYVAFFATGAYLYALLTGPERGGGFDTGIPFWVVLPMALLLAALVGVALGIPVLRLRGDYLAIVTLGFGEIIRIMLNNNPNGLTQGPQGVFGLPDTSILNTSITTPFEYYYLILAGCLIAAFATERILGSRVGRAWEAIREDEDVAASMGIDTTLYKLLAFAIGAAIGGAGGVIFAAKQGSVFPSDFDLNVSINVLALVIIGGMGNVRGVLLGAFLLIGLPDVLRDFSVNLGFAQFNNIGQDYRLVIFGAALVTVMVLRPEGLIPSRRRAAEFEQAEQLEAEMAT